jgi:hypothetical protein
MEADHLYYDVIRNDPRYKDGPTAEEFPTCESLKLTIGILVYLDYCVIRNDPRYKEGPSDEIFPIWVPVPLLVMSTCIKPIRF